MNEMSAPKTSSPIPNPDSAGLLAENHALRERIEELEHQIRLLKLELFGRGREKVNSNSKLPAYPETGPRQLYLPLFEAEGLVAGLKQKLAEREAAAAVAAAKGSDSEKPKKTKNGHGRRADFPKNAPEYTTVIDLPEDQKTCGCGEAMHEMPSEAHRELERVEFTVVHVTLRKKYCCRKCDGIFEVAPAPPQVLERGLLGPSFLSWLVVERLGQHMPYNRLERKLKGEGFSIARSLMCESVGRLADLLEPIWVRQIAEILAEGVVHCDDTPVTIQQAKSGGSATGYVWVYCDHRGRVIYTFTERRNRDGPLEMLRNYRGYLQVDAFSAYDVLFTPGDILEVACWAHARRRFVQALDDNPLAKQACDLIGDLYAIEREAKEQGVTGDALRELRQTRAKPILDTIFDWLCVQQTRALPKSSLGKAIRYALNQWSGLCRYLESGEIEIDNNRAERNLRAIAVGRNSWTFVGNETFGRKAAVMFSLVSTCRELGIEPRVYLWDVMQRISTETDVGKLTPTGWKMQFAEEATKNWEAHVAKLASASVNASAR